MRAGLALMVLIALVFGLSCEAFSQTTITAHKFKDDDRDGLQDAGEDSLSNWPMGLFAGPGCSDLIAESRTDIDGDAVFDVDPGSYFVGERYRPGWEATTDRCQQVDIDDDSVTVSFGNFWIEDKEWR